MAEAHGYRCSRWLGPRRQPSRAAVRGAASARVAPSGVARGGKHLLSATYSMPLPLRQHLSPCPLPVLRMQAALAFLSKRRAASGQVQLSSSQHTGTEAFLP